MKRRMLILLSVFGLLMAGCPETTPTSVTIKFDANGGTGTMKEIVVDSGAETVLTSNAFVRDGYTFKDWNDSKDGKGKSYADKAKVKPTADMTLFAQWEVMTVEITFNSNPPADSGATATETKQTVAVGQEVTLEAPDVSIEGYTLSGWAKDKTAAASEYSNGGTITVTEAITLYAVWQKNEGETPVLKKFGISNSGNTTGTYADSTVTLSFSSNISWTWPTDVTVSVTKNSNSIESANLDTTGYNRVTIDETLAAGTYTYTVVFSADGYEDLTLKWTVTVGNGGTTTPDAVSPATNLEIATDIDSMTISWTLSETPDATYEVTYQNGESNPVSVADITTAAATQTATAVVNGLETGAAYTVTVTAVKDGQKSQAVTKDVTLDTIVRGDRTFVLDKKFKLSGNSLNEVLTNKNQNSDQGLSVSVGIGTTGLQIATSATKGNANVNYQIVDGAGVYSLKNAEFYAEIKYQFTGESNQTPAKAVGIGLGNNTSGINRGWGTMFVYTDPKSNGRFSFRDENSAFPYYTESGETVTCGTWYRAGMHCNGTTKKFYLNSTLKGTGSASKFAFVSNDAVRMYFGQENNGASTLVIESIAFYYPQ